MTTNSSKTERRGFGPPEQMGFVELEGTEPEEGARPPDGRRLTLRAVRYGAALVWLLNDGPFGFIGVWAVLQAMSKDRGFDFWRVGDMPVAEAFSILAVFIIFSGLASGAQAMLVEWMGWFVGVDLWQEGVTRDALRDFLLIRIPALFLMLIWFAAWSALDVGVSAAGIYSVPYRLDSLQQTALQQPAANATLIMATFGSVVCQIVTHVTYKVERHLWPNS